MVDRRPSPIDRPYVMTFLYPLVIAVFGAVGATWLGLPAAALLGSTLSVSIAAILRMPGSVPGPLRHLAFTAIGVTLGSGVTPTIVQEMVQWTGSLAALFLTVILTMGASSLILVRAFRQRWSTALMSTSPGALTVAVNLAADTDDDVRAVITLQSVRLLAVTLMLPPVIGLIEPDMVGRMAATTTAVGYGAGFALMLGAAVLGLALTQLRMPAAFLIAGMILSGAAHYAGWVEGRLPTAMNLVGFAVAGAVIGTRFRSITLAEFRRSGAAAATVSAIGIGFSAVISWGVATTLGMPFGQVWVAFAPGGVEAMASMALSFGYDPIYVASHHIFRLLVLLLGLPIAIRLVLRLQDRG